VAGTTLISSLPYTISASGCYKTNGNLDAGTGSGISIGANGVNLYITDTIWFGDSSAGGVYNNNQYGISISPLAESLYIHGNGTAAIISKGGGGEGITTSDTSWGSVCIKTVSVGYTHFDSLRLSGNGGNAQCLQLNGRWYCKVTNCYMANNSKQYTDRTLYVSAVVEMSNFDSDDSIPGDDGFHALFQNNTIDSGHHTGIRAKGVVKILDNTIRLSALNTLYPTGPTNPSQNTSNTYGITLRQCSVMVIGDSMHVAEVKRNTFDSYHAYFGMDGAMEIERCIGHPDTPLIIADNNSHIHRGWDNHYTASSGLIARHIKIRSEGGNIRVKVKHDTAYTYANERVSGQGDTTSAMSSYGDWCAGFYILTSSQDTGCVFESCYVQTVTLLDTTDGDFSHTHHGSSPLMLLSDWYLIGGVPTVAVRDCEFVTNHIGVRFGYTDDRAIWYDSIYGNTFTFRSDTGAGREHNFFFAMADGGNSIDNDINDNDVSPDSVWDIADWSNSTGNARVRRTLDVYVKGVDKIAVANCTVQVWNDYGDTSLLTDTIASGVTDIYGWYYPQVTLLYSAYDASDSLETGFNPFVFKAFKNGDSVIDSTSFYPYDDEDTLDLPLSGGGGINPTERFTFKKGTKGGTGTRATLKHKE
jgi:hypothetical protein